MHYYVTLISPLLCNESRLKSWIARNEHHLKLTSISKSLNISRMSWKKKIETTSTCYNNFIFFFHLLLHLDCNCMVWFWRYTFLLHILPWSFRMFLWRYVWKSALGVSIQRTLLYISLSIYVLYIFSSFFSFDSLLQFFPFSFSLIHIFFVFQWIIRTFEILNEKNSEK